MRLPRLPVSRRRHEALRQVNEHNMAVAGQHEEQLREVRLVRDRARAAARDYAREAQTARARVAELEQAICWHRSHPHANGVDRQLYAVLDGHDRQERGDADPAGHVAQHPVRRESCCYVCGSSAWNAGQRIYLGGEEHWRHAECQPPKAADVQGHARQEHEGFRVEEHADVPDGVKLAPEPESDHDWTGRRRWGPDWQHLQGGWP